MCVVKKLKVPSCFMIFVWCEHKISFFRCIVVVVVFLHVGVPLSQLTAVSDRFKQTG